MQGITEMIDAREVVKVTMKEIHPWWNGNQNKSKMKLATEMKFVIQVSHAIKSMYDGSGNWNAICNENCAGNKISEVST